MTQLKELLEKEELADIKQVKEDLSGETPIKANSAKISKTWIWVAAIIAAVVILK